ncbi:stage II sporulation protein M [Fimbriimonas ginsengisoli]|uniref:Integral membrane protein n=1 Tax=Fimbriimonas ginsengisoli Gsoil 348 TaxID=661478 RepID=A0A068NPP3_FIMGI|nr:stage II sporulation protein M [Fimbriimonas ginsengisoli]AIE84725.1 hypothetical protein OP10G_1357 [Fimbriimonas ginsengisoli Gsoil 348]
MNEQAFVEKREQDWQRLTRLCDVADAGASRLTGAEVREFVKLYRRVSTDLALARTSSTNSVLVDFLNDLVGRAYATLYREPRPSVLKSIALGVALAAQTVRRRKWFVLTSAAIFFGSAFFSFFLLSAFPDTRDVLIPPGVEKLFGGWKKGEFEERSTSTSFIMTGFYANNNPRVAVIAGAVGAGTFGVASVYMVFENGAMLGSLAHEVNEVGNLDFLVSSVAPHGVPELSGAIVGGSAGLLLGWALINPGRRSRSAALKAVGRDAIVLLATSVILMFIAAPIEGFFSFNPRVPGAAKVLVAVVSLAAWLVFWSRYGRTAEE